MVNLDNFNNLLKFDEKNQKITIAVAMSGGVDSSTVAYILKKQGFNLIGITMKTCENEDLDAKKICDDLGIPHYLLDAQKEFSDIVINYFVDEYLQGKTPNPCMVCNRFIKFGLLLDFALDKGVDFMATGHYAQLVDGVLSMGNDENKDQAYFLSQIKKENLEYIKFPIGNLEKSVVRELAKELGVRVYEKKDSQEICFIEDGKLKEFLLEKTDGKAGKNGDIVNTSGNFLGKHKGLSFYTIGQRKGLGISRETPLYVVALDHKKNRVIVGSKDELFKNRLIAQKINMITVDALEDMDNLQCFAKTRSRDKLHKCSIKVINKENIEVVFTEEYVRAITPGQGIVLYDSEHNVIASGYIS